MCGWVGVFGVAPPEERLEGAATTLAERGPDGAGTHRDPEASLPFGIAHRRLAILDPSPAGAQPMRAPEHGVSVVYNGELYNSPALRRELESRGVTFSSGTDTEVLLRGWVHWGDAVLDRIEGIFSFALVDERAGRVLLARDRLGVKPLYWAHHDGVVVAGSAPRALFAAHPTLPRDLDDVARAQFLTLLWIPHPRTPWRAIRKLEPGHAVVIDHQGVHPRAYWRPPAPGTGRLEPDELLGTIRHATRAQLLSDVPVGLLFSGGLDSAILLALMAEHYGTGELQAVTAGYDATAQRLEIAPDDLRYAREVAGSLPQLDLREVRIDRSAGDDLTRLARHFDDPVADPAAITLFRLCRAADTKVLLSGVGGEELFAGYPRHLALPHARRLAGLPRPVRHLGGRLAPALWGSVPGPLYPARRNVQKLLLATADPGVPHYWRLLSQLGLADVAGLIPGAAATAWAELDAQCPPIAATTLGDALEFDRAQFLPNLNLSYVDKASMAASVEVRVPLLDEAVVRAAFPADPNRLIVDGVSKAPLRAAARGVVPDAVIDRPKSGFGGPVRDWFRSAQGAQLAERIDAAANRGLVCTAPARAVYRAAASGRRDAALAAWALVCLDAWAEAHT